MNSQNETPVGTMDRTESIRAITLLTGLTVIGVLEHGQHALYLRDPLCMGLNEDKGTIFFWEVTPFSNLPVRSLKITEAKMLTEPYPVDDSILNAYQAALESRDRERDSADESQIPLFEKGVGDRRALDDIAMAPHRDQEENEQQQQQRDESILNAYEAALESRDQEENEQQQQDDDSPYVSKSNI